MDEGIVWECIFLYGNSQPTSKLSYFLGNARISIFAIRRGTRRCLQSSLRVARFDPTEEIRREPPLDSGTILLYSTRAHTRNTHMYTHTHKIHATKQPSLWPRFRHIVSSRFVIFASSSCTYARESRASTLSSTNRANRADLTSRELRDSPVQELLVFFLVSTGMQDTLMAIAPSIFAIDIARNGGNCWRNLQL